MISENFTIRFGTKLHEKVKSALQARIRLSEKDVSTKRDKWNEAEDTAIAHVSETETDKLRDVARGSGMPQYTTIDVPYSQAMLLSAHTYWTSVFLSRDPVLQFTARHGEPAQQVQAVEALMNYQTTVGEHLVPYFIWLYDAGKYGLGVLAQHWADESTVVSRIVEKQPTMLGMPFGEPKKVKTKERVQGYQGIRLFNVRPYDFIADPRVPYSQLQKGEFCGRRIRDFSLNDLHAGAEEGLYFNVDVLNRRMGKGAVSFNEEGSGNVQWPQPEESSDGFGTADEKGNFGTMDPGYIDLIEMHVRLVPKDWGLGKSSMPEKWVFTLARNDVIIGARPLGEYHDKFPFSILEQEIEGYSLIKRGMLEQMQPMNDIMTWLFNSHFYNVRAALNNQFVYDPSAINRKDLTDPNPGKRIRMKPDAWGRDVRSAISQLPVMDVTQGHIRDIDVVGSLMQRAGGVTDNIMGLVNAGGRKTATEVRTSSSFGINRLKTVAEYMSAMAFAPNSQMMLQSTQQHYDQQQKFRIVGDLTNRDPFVDVSPEGIAGFYDYIAVDGTLPIDRFAQANLWKELLGGLNQIPQVAQQYDIAGIFAWVAQLSGLRNINQFKVNVVDDAQLQNQVQAGNSVPIQEAAAAAGQLPNVGPTG